MGADLKTSNPSQWYSKIKYMSGKSESSHSNNLVDELAGLSDQEQAECIGDHYSSISNQYEQVQHRDFPNFNPFSQGDGGSPPPLVEPLKVYQVIQELNKKAATVPSDITYQISPGIWSRNSISTILYHKFSHTKWSLS